MILIVGFGNLLRRDDGFGVHMLRRLRGCDWLPADVRLHEAGIGGVSMVQELLTPVDALIVLDAFEQGEVGTLRVVEVTVDDVRLDAEGVSRDYLADIHQVEPAKAIAIARGVGVLPERVYLVGPVGRDFELGESLSAEVVPLLAEGEAAVRELVASLQR